MSKFLSVDSIRIDGGTQCRSQVCDTTVAEYCDLWNAKVDFPPLVVFHDGNDYWLADGFHRYLGGQRAGRASFPVEVHKGTKRDAILYAVGANRSHGLKRSNADKRKAVEILLNDAEWVAWSDRAVADAAGVSDTFVSAIRKQLQTVGSSPAAHAAEKPRVGKDGKTRKPPAPKAPKAPKAEPQAEAAEPARSARESFNVEEIEAEQAAANAVPVHDSLKAEVPEDLKPAFRLAEQFEKHRSAVSQVKAFLSKELDGIAKRTIEPMFNQAKTDLGNLTTALKFAMPFCVCVYCKAKEPKRKNCNACKGDGWITEAVYKSAPESLRK